jgi:hypothetical protein
LTTTTSIYQIFFTVVVKVSNNSTWTEWEAGRRKQVLSSLYFPFGALSGKGREGKGRLGTFEHYCLTNLSLWVGSGGGCQCESPDSCELCAHVCSSWWIEHACMHAYTPPSPLTKVYGVSMRNPVWLVLCMPACSTWCSWDMYISTYKQKKCWFLHVMLLASQILNPWPQMMGSKVAAKFKLVAIKSILVWIRLPFIFPSTLDQPRTCDRTMWM